ncbi:MAG: hypothetical protein MUO21_02485 [Nitrososphaeraceae archaeon]|nr:hypothetical protein [Nitrososphaeraceae archaeon]
MNEVKPSDRIRALISYILFDEKVFGPNDHEKSSFPNAVRIGFKDWIERKNDRLVRYTYLELPQDLDSDTFVFWKKDKKRFTAAVFLYAIIGHFRFRKSKEDKHGKLISELLDCLIDGKEVDREKVNNVYLEYYWNDTTVSYLAKVTELLDMTDDEFMKLPDFDTWLNTVD